MSRNKVDRTGEINMSNEGCVMKIVEYNNNYDVVIEFRMSINTECIQAIKLLKRANAKTHFIHQYMDMVI